MNEHLDMVAITSEGFVNRIIDYLVNQVMKATGTGSANVHARALANGVKAFEDLNRIRAVVFFFVSHHTLLTMNRNRADGTPGQVGGYPNRFSQRFDSGTHFVCLVMPMIG